MNDVPASAKPAVPEEIKAGDIVGFSGRSWISAGINIATYGIPLWGISHVGIMAHAPDGRLLIFESTSLEDLPCEISHENFTGTQAHLLDDILRVYDGKAWHYPLYRPLYDYEDKRLTEFLMATIHTPYDAMGAFRSAGVGLSWVESLFHPENLHSIFCSEWVAAAYANIGLVPTANAARWNPNHLVRHLRGAEVLLEPPEAQMKRILVALVLLASVAGCRVSGESGNLSGQEGTADRQRPGSRCGKATGSATRAWVRASTPR